MKCEKHNRKKAHTGGKIYICPECELEYFEDHPKEIQHRIKILAEQTTEPELNKRAEKIRKGEKIGNN